MKVGGSTACDDKFWDSFLPKSVERCGSAHNLAVMGDAVLRCCLLFNLTLQPIPPSFLFSFSSITNSITNL